KKNQNDIAKLDDEIRNLQTKLNTQRLTLTQEAMMNLNSDIERKQTQRKRFAEDSNREMNELSARLFQKIQNELIPIIQQIGKDMNLDVIFDLSQSGTLYFNPTIDLTEEVIKRYDASKAAK
ncbi:MAG: OmpH family outer membrane protein, partial [Candidatus Aminicenantes bacterium]|nr:OmpH family outer membrane protein [Candidatus Aminicenantes bacterium]